MRFSRFFLFAAATLLTALLVHQMWLVLSIGGLTGVEKAMLVLFVVNIAWVALGAISPLVGFLLTLSGWRTALWVIAGLGVAVALGVGRWLPRDPTSRSAPSRTAPGPARVDDGTEARSGFGLLVAIGTLDNAARPAFLLYLPFLLQEKGAALTTVGLALSLVFIGGALGKAVCGRLGERLGVTRTVLLTETGSLAEGQGGCGPVGGWSTKASCRLDESVDAE